MWYTAAAAAAVDGGAVRRLEVERLVVVDSRLPLVVRARGNLVVLERRLVVPVVARAVSEHGGGRIGAVTPWMTASVPVASTMPKGPPVGN